MPSKLAEKIVADLMEIEVEDNRHIRTVMTQCVDAHLTPLRPFLTDDGEVRKVLGTLPLTVDGFVVGEAADIWFWLNGNLYCVTTAREQDTQARALFSTQAAALAHRAEGDNE